MHAAAQAQTHLQRSWRSVPLKIVRSVHKLTLFITSNRMPYTESSSSRSSSSCSHDRCETACDHHLVT